METSFMLVQSTEPEHNTDDEVMVPLSKYNELLDKYASLTAELTAIKELVNRVVDGHNIMSSHISSFTEAIDYVKTDIPYDYTAVVNVADTYTGEIPTVEFHRKVKATPRGKLLTPQKIGVCMEKYGYTKVSRTGNKTYYVKSEPSQALSPRTPRSPASPTF